MWAALLFLLGFDEAVHGLGYEKGQTKKDQPHTTTPHLSSYAVNC